MTDNEIEEWVATLDPRRSKKVQIIKDLLSHASTDRMSQADRVICVRALAQLEAQGIQDDPTDPVVSRHDLGPVLEPDEDDDDGEFDSEPEEICPF